MTLFLLETITYSKDGNTEFHLSFHRVLWVLDLYRMGLTLEYIPKFHLPSSVVLVLGMDLAIYPHMLGIGAFFLIVKGVFPQHFIENNTKLHQRKQL